MQASATNILLLFLQMQVSFVLDLGHKLRLSTAGLGSKAEQQFRPRPT